jgi:ribonuclease III
VAEIAELEKAIEHKFKDRSLLVQALTHSSLAYEQTSRNETPSPDSADNEQMEFLGDAVVGLLVAEHLYSRHPELKEGPLTRLRAHLVSRKHLGQVAAKLGLGQYLRLGKGEERSGGRKKSALLANGMEALIGALYLDGGLHAAKSLVEQFVLQPYLEELEQQLIQSGVLGDHKSALQELLQAKKSGTPEYVVRGESGPDHRKRFLVEVCLTTEGQRSRSLARGIGATKKKAEQEAARRAFQKLQTAAAATMQNSTQENPRLD